MLCGLDNARLEMILPEMGLQLRTPPAISFLTMNSTPYCCFFFYSEDQNLPHSLLMFHWCESIWRRTLQWCPFLSSWVLNFFPRHSEGESSMFRSMYPALVSWWCSSFHLSTCHAHHRLNRWSARPLLIRDSIDPAWYYFDSSSSWYFRRISYPTAEDHRICCRLRLVHTTDRWVYLELPPHWALAASEDLPLSSALFSYVF